MKEPFVSVAMSSYNHEKYIGRAIDSLLNQTYKNFELLITDDGSTDHSVDIIKGYEDKRIRFIKFDNNTNFEAERYMYQQVKGKYMLTVSSDDMWDCTILEKYVTFMEQNEEYGACSCLPYMIDEEDHVINEHVMYGTLNVENALQEEWFHRFFFKGNCICAPAVFIRTEVYRKFGPFRYQYKQLQDFEFWLRMVQSSNIYVYPERLFFYRWHPDSETPNISSDKNSEVLVRDKMERMFIMLDIMEQVEEDFFIKSFEHELRFLPDSLEFHIDCEKFGILLDAQAAPTESALLFYYKHYNDVIFREHLEMYYQVGRGEFWKLSGSDFDDIIKIYRQKCEQLKQIVKLQEKILDM